MHYFCLLFVTNENSYFNARLIDTVNTDDWFETWPYPILRALQAVFSPL